MRNTIVLPHGACDHDSASCPRADVETESLIGDWLAERLAFARKVWGAPPPVDDDPVGADPAECIDSIVGILLHRKFNHQSRGRVAHVIPSLRSRLERIISENRPVTLFFLYNGAYRASPFPNRLQLVFEPDQTEFLLLDLIAQLQARIRAFYSPGIDFVIVVNNGVALQANEIPVAATEAYVARLRGMIDAVGAAGRIRLLVQSELEGGTRAELAIGNAPCPIVSAKDHAIVERFLGRECGPQEASYRAALYKAAEAAWAEVLRPLAAAGNAIVLRQVAHPETLSFRPFGGGAIRSQNGTVGFLKNGGALLPKLLTVESFEQHDVRLASIGSPWSTGQDSGLRRSPAHA